MLLSFTLTMPGRNTWNGKWTGDKELYAKVRNVPPDETAVILEEVNFQYRWSDGWCANVEVKEVSKTEANRIRRNSQGFCGYEWMIDSIIKLGYITPDFRTVQK